MNNGQLVFDMESLKAYELAKKIANDGKVANMEDIIKAKILSKEFYSPIWTNYVTSTSGEFLGKSAGGIPIVAIVHGIEDILSDEEVIQKSTADFRENSKIQLSPKQFRNLETGHYGPAEIIELETIKNMRKYASTALNFEASINEPLLNARLGRPAKEFFEKHRELTMEESGNDYILTNEHKYHYVKEKDFNQGKLIIISQPINMMRGQEPTSVSSKVDTCGLGGANRFLALQNPDQIEVHNDISNLLDDLESNYENFQVPHNSEGHKMYGLMQVGTKIFAMYEKDGARTDSHKPKFVVNDTKKIETKMFKTTIGGYHGFFKFGLDEVMAIAPETANAYLMGEPEIIWKDGNPEYHAAPITFYEADVDTSKRILRPDEVKNDFDLLRSLL